MASMNKANQRQQGKSKQGKRHGYKKIRMTKIPMVCPACNQTVDLPSTEAYKQGGNTCPRCGNKMQMDVHRFTNKLIKK